LPKANSDDFKQLLIKGKYKLIYNWLTVNN